MNENSISKLQEAITKGLYAKEFMNSEGYKIYLAALEDMIADNKNKWLLGSDEEAKEIRMEARGIQKAINLLKKFVIVGDNASRIVDDIKSDLQAPGV